MRGKGIGLVASGMIAGIFIGSHMVGAIGASAPCGTATAPSPTKAVSTPVLIKQTQTPTPTRTFTPAPTVKPTSTPIPRGHIIRIVFRYTGDTTSDAYGDSNKFRLRGSFTLWAHVAPLNPRKVAEAYSVCVFSNVSSLGTCTPKQIAIDIGGKALTDSTRVTDKKCQFGCYVGIVSAENVKWDIRILQ